MNAFADMGFCIPSSEGVPSSWGWPRGAILSCEVTAEERGDKQNPDVLRQNAFIVIIVLLETSTKNLIKIFEKFC